MITGTYYTITEAAEMFGRQENTIIKCMDHLNVKKQSVKDSEGKTHSLDDEGMETLSKFLSQKIFAPRSPAKVL